MSKCTLAQWAYIKKLRQRLGQTPGARPRSIADADALIKRLEAKAESVPLGSWEQPTEAQLRLLGRLVGLRPYDPALAAPPRTKLEAAQRIDALLEEQEDEDLVASHFGDAR